MSRRKTGRKNRGKSDRDAKYDEINKAILMDIIPEMHRINVKKYFRGFEEVPSDFQQICSEDSVLVTKDEVVNSIKPDYFLHRRHVMLVGVAGCGKSTVLERVFEELGPQILSYMVFPVDLHNYSGDEVLNVTEFLFHRRGMADLETGGLGKMFGTMAAHQSERVIFMLNGLDMMPAEFEAECEEIREGEKASTRVVLHNLLIGNIYPSSKILSTCRHYRAKNFKGNLCPDEIIAVGELSDHSVKAIARGVLGQEHFQEILDIWDKQSQSLCLLNRTASYLMYNILSAGTGESFRYQRTMPMTMLNLAISCVNPLEQTFNKKDVVPIIHKIKELAYFGIQEGKYVFSDRKVERQFKLSLREIEMVTATLHGKYAAQYNPVLVQGRVLSFLDLHNQEFMCALNVPDLPIEEYKVFLRDCIHKPRYSVIRRMVCSLILDQNVNGPALREKLIQVSDDMQLRKELLLASMRAEYHVVKRRNLLQFLHAVRDCGDGGLNILPKKVDVIDLSHLKLYLLDMQAIGASISGNVRVGYLNLSNCDVTLNGLSVLRSKLQSTKTRIYGLNLDWCNEWTEHFYGIEALCDIIKACEIKELSINHVSLFAGGLHMLDVTLGAAKIKTIRMEHSKSLTEEAYAILGDLIMRHEVENLYITAKDITPKQKSKMCYGLREFKIKESMSMPDSTMYVGRLDVGSGSE